MKSIILTVLAFFSITALAIDHSLVPYRDGEKWGYSDAHKKMIITPRFQRAWWFADNGLARVKIGDKYGFIDKKGKLAIEAKFDEANDFWFEGAFVVMNGRKYCLDKAGRTTEKTDGTKDCSGLYSDNSPGVCSGCCEAFRIGGKCGTVCKSNEFDGKKFITTASDSIPAIYDTVYSPLGYNHDFTPLVAKMNHKYGIISNKNNIIYPFEYDSIAVTGYNSFMLCRNKIWSFSDTARAMVQDIEAWDYIYFYSGQTYIIRVANQWGAVAHDGSEILPVKFEEIILPTRMIIQREFAVKMNGKWGYLSDAHKITPKYDTLEPFNGEQYTLVMKDGKEGYINLSGTEFFK
jgi:hypothetical protein